MTFLLILFPFFVALLVICVVVFWIKMLIHAATKPIDNKIVWVIIICLAQIVGVLIYYFVVYREYKLKEKPVEPTTPA